MVDNQQVHSPVPPSARMHLVPWRLPGHLVSLVHYVKKLLEILGHE